MHVQASTQTRFKPYGTAGILMMILSICLLLCSLVAPLQGLEIIDPEEVEYIRLRAEGTVGGSVTLDCGPTMPTIFIWAHSGPGSDKNTAVAYNYGQGPKLQVVSGSLGGMKVPANRSSLVIEGLHKGSAGTYTCQALYDTEEGARVAFYFTQLSVGDD